MRTCNVRNDRFAYGENRLPLTAARHHEKSQSNPVCHFLITLFTLSIRTPQLLTMLVLKFEQVQFLLPGVMIKNVGRVANNVDNAVFCGNSSWSTQFYYKKMGFKGI